MYSFNLENIHMMCQFVISNSFQKTDFLSFLIQLCKKHFNVKIGRGESEMSNYVCFEGRNFVFSEKKL